MSLQLLITVVVCLCSASCLQSMLGDPVADPGLTGSAIQCEQLAVYIGMQLVSILSKPFAIGEPVCNGL